MNIRDVIQMIEGATEEEKMDLCKVLTPILDEHAQDVFWNAVHANSQQGANKPCATITAWLALPPALRHLFTNGQPQKYE